ncbi:MAG: hypothetical protein KF698_04250 [Anaerolineales bacterium]|nr:hypothetical protein [Anaerolineales bacterium]
MKATRPPFTPHKPTALPARLAALGLLALALAACSSPAAEPTQTIAPSATAEASSTPTPEPTATLVPTATEFPYELPPLPSLEGITVEKLPECDLSVLGQSDLTYYASVVTEDDKKYLVPHPTQLDVENFKSCDLYVVDTNSSPRDKLAMNILALTKVILNGMYSEGSDYQGIVYQDIKWSSPYARFDDVGKMATGILGGVVGESLAWVAKSGMRGLIYVNNTKLDDPLNREAYFFESSSIPQELMEKCNDCFYTVYPYKVSDGLVAVFGTYNDTHGRVYGIVKEDNAGYVFIPRHVPGFDYSIVEIDFSPTSPPAPLTGVFSSE